LASQLNGGIQWCDVTWNPIRGCSMAKGSELGGCLNCYAARQASRFTGEGSPFAGFARVTENGPRWTGKVELVEKHLTDPLKWKAPRRVFVNSMSDLFHEALHLAEIDRIFDVMERCPQHTFQVLTKRPGWMRHYMATMVTQRPSWPLPNVWLGVSVEDQATAGARIPLLLRTPAAVRFVSYEPALGPVDWGHACVSDGARAGLAALDWIIVGGESGPGARPFDVQWARDTVAQCRDAGVACFVKQLGARPRGPEQSVPDWVSRLDRKGGNWEVWPDDLRVREFPT